MASTSDTRLIERETAAPARTAGARPAAGSAGRVWALTRLSLGWVFLWGFLDKAFGLGLDTARAESWINGGSPTAGFLTFGTSGPLTGVYQRMAGAAWADWLYMLGLLGLAVALIFGIGMRIAAVAGATLLALIWAAQLWPERNPFIDRHVIYALVLAGLAAAKAGDTWGLGRWWGSQRLVRRFPVLR